MRLPLPALLLGLLLTPLQAQRGPSLATPQGPEARGGDRLPGELHELPGVRLYSGRLIARPLQLAELRRAGITRSDAEHLRARAGRVLASYRPIRHVTATDEWIVRTPAGVSDPDACAALRATGLFEYVEPDWLLAPPEVPNVGKQGRTGGSTPGGPTPGTWRRPDDPFLSLQWHHTRMRSLRGWGIETGSPTIAVGVCDTGIRTDHEDLLLHRLEGYNAVDRLWESQGGAIGPIYHHGTRTTGALAANGDNGVGVSGVGWNLSHRMLRVSNMTNGNAFLSDLQHAARTSIESGDRIANVSYAGVLSFSNLTTADYIRSLGGILVWAAGNNSSNYASPGRDADSLLVVGATDINENLASFSNYGAFVDLVAPGDGIYTSNSWNSTAYTWASGTSYAAPIAAGVCALIWSAHPELSPDDVVYTLKHSAQDLGTPGIDDVFGYGRVDTERALRFDATRTPTADLSLTPASGRSPLAVQFRDLSSGVPTQRLWDFGDGTTSTLRNPTHTYTTSGRYAVTLTVTNAEGTSTLTLPDAVAVDFIPPTAAFVGTPTAGLSPLPVQFTDTSAGGAPTSWSWDFGDGTTSTQQHPSHTYTTSGRFSVSLTATNAYGSTTATTADYVTVDWIPPVASFQVAPTSGASPLVVQCTDTSTGGVATSWSWNFGDFGTSTLQDPTHTYTQPGSFTISLTASNAYGSDTLSVPGSVVVGPGPSIVANFTGTPTTGTAPLTVSFTDLSVGNIVSWAWDFGDGGLSSLQNPTHTYTVPGQYNVALQVTNASGKDSQLERKNYIDVR